MPQVLAGMGLAGATAGGASAATAGAALAPELAGGASAALGAAVAPELAGGASASMWGPAASTMLGMGKAGMGALGTAAPIVSLLQGPSTPAPPAQINPRPQQYAGNKPGSRQQGGNDEVIALLRALLQGGQV